MGHQIVMAPEAEKWLADVRDRHRAAADWIDSALAALRAGGSKHCRPPLAVPVDWPLLVQGSIGAERALPAASRQVELQDLAESASIGLFTLVACQGKIPHGAGGPGRRTPAAVGVLARMRRAAAVSRKRPELQIGQLETETSEADSQRRLDALRRERAAMQSQEEHVCIATRRQPANMAAFQDAREAVGTASREVEEAAEAAWAQLNADIEGARSACPGAGITRTSALAHLSFWLRELQPRAPESTQIRIVFTLEPADTAVLLATGAERYRLRDWHTEVVIPVCRRSYRREQIKHVLKPGHYDGSTGS